MPAFARPLLAEAAAAVGALCLALHVVTAVAPGHGDLLARGVLLAMATGCLPCIRGLWLRGSVERRQERTPSTEPETSAATRAEVPAR